MRTFWVALVAAVSFEACNCNVTPPNGEDGGTGGGTMGAGGGSGGSSTGGGTSGTGGGLQSCTIDETCYPFDAGSPGSGACRAGTAQCVNGTLGPCTGSIGPSSEACNSVDDDCNGSVDDGLGTTNCGIGACRRMANTCVDGGVSACTPGTAVAEVCGNAVDEDCDGVLDNGCNCVNVGPAGVDAPTWAPLTPVRHINYAIGLALDAGVTSICVSGGLAGPSSSFDYGGASGETLNMQNGISIYGGYCGGAAWGRDGGCVTRLTATTAQGVVFDHPVTSPTAIDGFDLVGGDFAVSAAVTVRGSTGAIVNNDRVTGGNGASVTTSIGVDVVDVGNVAATPTISNSMVTGAVINGTAIGVRSTNSQPTLTRNCNTYEAVTGRCSSGCGGAMGIRGASGVADAGTPTAAYGVLLESSAGALVDTSGICDVQGGAAHVTGAAVKLQGLNDRTTVRRSNVTSFGASQNGVGVWIDPCRSGAPRVFDNFFVAGSSNVVGSRTDGVRVIGACDAVIDSNRRISGGLEQAGQNTNGVYCAQDSATKVASKCTVQNNATIAGSAGGFPPQSVGVRCDDGACAVISGNTITGQAGNFAAGVVVSKSGPVIFRNTISAGCGRNTSIGLQSIDSSARVENNIIHGGSCPNPTATMDSYAVLVVNAGTKNELDLHSNSLWGDGATVACSSRGLAFDSDAGTPPLGLVRNNAISAGLCTNRWGLQELSATADPRLLQNNWFDTNVLGTILYRDEAATDLADAGAINALTDITSSRNIEGGACGTSGSYQLTSTSPCRNGGTDAGAPTVDFAGDRRPQESAFDISADEFIP